MDINEIRIKNLLSVIDNFKNLAEFARTYNIDANYMSMLIHHHRSFGEKTARKLEISMSKPIGFLDTTEAHPLDQYKVFFDSADSGVRNSILTILEALQVTYKQQLAQQQEKENAHDVKIKSASQ